MDYTVKSSDRTSGTWQDQPSAFDANTGTITVQVSHLRQICPVYGAPCFTRHHSCGNTQTDDRCYPAGDGKAADHGHEHIHEYDRLVVSVVMNNIVILVIIIVLAIAAVFFYRKGKFPGW